MPTFKNLNSLQKSLTRQIEKDINKMNLISNYNVKYGVPKGSVVEGNSIADYGRINDEGSKNIPRRPWLSTVQFRYQKNIYSNIQKAFDFIKKRENLKENEVKDVLTKYVCVSLINYTRNNIINGGWTANNPKTIKIKNSSKPLVDTGQLVASINSFAEKIEN